MSSTGAQQRLHNLLSKTPRRRVRTGERIVILSDLHMGNGRKGDDFEHNGSLCLDALRHFYLPRGYTLILNGDVEELLRVPRNEIRAAWKAMFDLFAEFRAADRLVWLWGNHEILPRPHLSAAEDPTYDGESLLLETEAGPLFIFHGHQAGVANSGRYNGLIGWSLKAFANTLGIGNRTIAHSDERKFKLEKAVHEFSRGRGLVSIIGHTHRPLFESLSKAESQAIRLEKLCRDYTGADEPRRVRIRRAVRLLRDNTLKTMRDKHHPVTRVYGELPVPCVFNSGCAVGKRGFTTLEIKNGRIALVFWSFPERSWIPGAYNEYKPSRCFGGGAYRTILRREALDYVFSRIDLLGEP